MKALYPLALCTLGAEEIRAAKSVLDSGSLTMGWRVKAFEKAFARYTGSRHALMVNSGSSANLLMVEALLRRTLTRAKLRPGDEVLVPALAWPTTVWPLVQLGLIPVFVDIDPHTLAMSLESAKKALRARTKALFLIHVLGRTPAMQSYLDFCRREGLVLLEDACESLGSYDGKTHVGNFGMMGSFSLYFSHHLSTIEGGVVVTSDSFLYDDLISLRSHGWIRGRSDRAQWIRKYRNLDFRFMFITSGYNVRPTEIQAAIGLVQLRKLDAMIGARARLAWHAHQLTRQYTPWLRLLGSEELPTVPSSAARKYRSHSWMALPFVLEDEAPFRLSQIKNLFESSGIETRPIIAGNLARHPGPQHMRLRQAGPLPQADKLFKKGFMIGCHPIKLHESRKLIEKTLQKITRST